MRILKVLFHGSTVNNTDKFNKKSIVTQRGLRIACINVRGIVSMNSKRVELNAWMTVNDIDVICIQEWYVHHRMILLWILISTWLLFQIILKFNKLAIQKQQYCIKLRLILFNLTIFQLFVLKDWIFHGLALSLIHI